MCFDFPSIITADEKFFSEFQEGLQQKVSYLKINNQQLYSTIKAQLQKDISSVQRNALDDVAISRINQLLNIVTKEI
jgi:hypothetical protein